MVGRKLSFVGKTTASSSTRGPVTNAGRGNSKLQDEASSDTNSQGSVGGQVVESRGVRLENCVDGNPVLPIGVNVEVGGRIEEVGNAKETGGEQG